MKDRLTEKHKISCFEYDLANFEHKVKEFNDYDAFYAYNMAVRKLGKLEDILEKHGIEDLEQLDKSLIKLIEARAYERKIEILTTELVKEVCEKIYERMARLSHKCIEFRERDGYSCAWFNIDMFKEILGQIEKEYENEKK